MEYQGSVAKSLRPTFENVTYEFITKTIYKLMNSKELPNFRIHFTEQEAMEYIHKILEDYSNSGTFAKRKSQEILKALEKKENTQGIPVMVINNYKEFFEQLRNFYEEHIRLFFKRTNFSSFHSYAMENCFDLIWLRMVPEDFNDPELFLRKQAQMIKDRTFARYDEEQCLGKVPCLEDNVLCVQNRVARIWDESSQEVAITIYDKDYYAQKELFNRPHYELPVVRYGIYEKNGKKVCRIGSIQNKEDDERDDVHKRVDRAKYRVNKGVAVDETKNVEPKSLIALSIFINLMHQADIEDIEVPSMYVLDYEYHLKRSEKLMEEFKGRWPDEDVAENDKKRYEYERKYLERTYGKHDLISEIKSERQIKLFTRLLKHYPQGQIRSYPSELDSYYHISIPRVKRKDDIQNDMLQQLYGLVAKSYEAIEI